MTSTAARFMDHPQGPPRLQKTISGQSQQSQRTTSTMDMSDYSNSISSYGGCPGDRMPASAQSEPMLLAGGRRRERYEKEYDKVYYPHNPARIPLVNPRRTSVGDNRPDSPPISVRDQPVAIISNGRTSRAARIAARNNEQTTNTVFGNPASTMREPYARQTSKNTVTTAAIAGQASKMREPSMFVKNIHREPLIAASSNPSTNRRSSTAMTKSPSRRRLAVVGMKRSATFNGAGTSTSNLMSAGSGPNLVADGSGNRNFVADDSGRNFVADGSGRNLMRRPPTPPPFRMMTDSSNRSVGSRSPPPTRRMIMADGSSRSTPPSRRMMTDSSARSAGGRSPPPSTRRMMTDTSSRSAGGRSPPRRMITGSSARNVSRSPPPPTLRRAMTDSRAISGTPPSPSIGSRRCQMTDLRRISTHPSNHSEPPALVSTNKKNLVEPSSTSGSVMSVYSPSSRAPAAKQTLAQKSASAHTLPKLPAMVKRNNTAPTRAPAPSTTYVQIQPGLKAPLRNTQETLDAIDRNYIARQSCLACTCEVYCIADAKYYICPVCREVSPSFSEASGLAPQGSYGVGLGFTPETLLKQRQQRQQQRM